MQQLILIVGSGKKENKNKNGVLCHYHCPQKYRKMFISMEADLRTRKSPNITSTLHYMDLIQTLCDYFPLLHFHFPQNLNL